MKTAVIYARYSSERQTEQSIEGQIRECTEFALRNDIVIVDTYIDRAMTGTNDNRTDFQRMLKDCTKKAWDIVLVYKLDRFSRNKYEMAMHRKTLRDNGIKLVSAMENIPDTPEGIILESLLEGMAEYYSAELAQKVRRGQRETRLKGNYAGGGVPYGYKVVNKHFVVQETYRIGAVTCTLIGIDAHTFSSSAHNTLTAVTLPKSIKFIGDDAFGGAKLTSITYGGTVEEWHKITFGDRCWGINNEITVTCTDGTVIIPAY